MAPRTLQRRLAAEGTSFQQELDHLRKTMATATLLDARSPVNEVAFLLGYSEPSTFYRSFKRWTGKTPEEFRRAS
jgi:AraC-like DNA-binding protein